MSLAAKEAERDKQPRLCPKSTAQEIDSLLNQSLQGGSFIKTISEICPYITEKYRDFSREIYHFLGLHCLSNPSEIMAAYDLINHLSFCSKTITEIIPDIPKEVTTDFLKFLNKVLSQFPLTLFESNSSPQLDRIRSWKEDESQQKHQTPIDAGSIWSSPTRKLSCQGQSGLLVNDQPLFSCYTCGLIGSNGICLACALNCHKGHNICYVGYRQFRCLCRVKTACKFFADQQVEPPQSGSSLFEARERRPNENPSDMFGRIFAQNLNNVQPDLRPADIPQIREIPEDPSQLRSFFYYLSHGQEPPQSPPQATEPSPRTSLVSEEPKTINEEQEYSSISNILKIFFEIANTTTVKAVQSDVKQRLTVPIQSVKFDNTKNVPFSFHYSDIYKMRPLSTSIADEISQRQPSIFQLQGNGSRSRSQLFPLKIASAVLSGDPQILAVADGKTIKTYNFGTFEQLHSYESDISILAIEVCPLDPSIIAIASMTSVEILQIDGDGSISLSYKIELLEASLGLGHFIITVEWVPNEPLHLAVIATSFIKIYDIPNDCISPLFCLIPEDGDSILSASIFSRDSKIYCLATTQNVFLALHECDLSDGSGPQAINHALPIVRSESPMIVSISSQTDIAFISNATDQMGIIPIDMLFADNPETVKLFQVNFGGNVTFLFNHPSNPYIYFFINNSSNSLATMEITDRGVELSANNTSFLSHFQVKDSIFSISSDGIIHSLVNGPGEEIPPQPIIPPRPFIPTHDTTDSPFEVPATFWTDSTIMPADIDIIVPNSILTTPIILSPSSNKVFVSCHSQTNVIVGLRISFLVAPKAVTVCSRKYEVGQMDQICIPLKKSEVGFNKAYILVFECQNDIKIGAIDCFGISGSSLNLNQNSDSEFLPDGSIWDFKDSLSPRCNNYKDNIELLISYAVSNGPLSDDDLKRLIEIMYTNRCYSTICRRILMKAAEKNVIGNWSKEIAKLISEGKVDSKLWLVAERDVSLLPKALRKEAEEALWKSWKPNAYTIAVAFRSE